MTTVPAVTPVTIPVLDPTVAIAVFSLTHVPPEVTLLKILFPPLAQTLPVPVIGVPHNRLFLMIFEEKKPEKRSGFWSPSRSPMAKA